MDGIIFDLDGTLWDSTEVVAVAFRRVLAKYAGRFPDLPAAITADRLKQLFGKPMDVIFAELMPGLPPAEQLQIGAECFAAEHEALEETPGALYQGVEETLSVLARKYPLFLVSNCQCGYIELFLRKTALAPYFQAHLCFGQTGTSKGQTILRLMRENRLGSAVYVGDTQGDADACREAKIPFVLAAYGFGSAEHPDYRIQSFEELQTLFA